MSKRVVRSLIILCITIIYCVCVGCFSYPIQDANVTFTVPSADYNGAVLQMFWDDGSGFCGENAIFAQVDQQEVAFSFSNEQLDQIVAFRLDPIAEEREIIFSKILLNGQEISSNQLLAWIDTTANMDYEVGNQGAGLFWIRPTSADPQIYLSPEFHKSLTTATTLSSESKKKAILIGIVIAVLLLFIHQIIIGGQYVLRTLNQGLEHILKGHDRLQNVLLIGLIALIAVIIFWDYLIAKRYYLFADVSDQYGQLYPQLIRNAELIKKGILYGGFDFTVGLGSVIGAIKPDLTNWVSFFSADHIAYLMGVGQFAKVLFSGICFYFIIKLQGQKKWFAAVLALGYAFCGHMTCRAFWGSYPNEVLLVAVWLLCFELWFQKKDFRFLPLATLIFFYQFNAGYYFYLYIAFFLGYALFRYLTETKMSLKVWGIIGAAGLVGGVLAATVFRERLFGEIARALGSDRAQGNINGFELGTALFKPELFNWKLVFGKTIGQGIYGIIGKNYTDQYWNFLEDPTLYCSVAVCLLIPLAFYCMNAKKRIGYAIGIIGALAICFCTQLRLLANGFSGATYKLCTFWIILFMLILVAQIDWDLFKEARKKKWAVRWTTLSLVVLLYGCYQLSFDEDVISYYLYRAIIFLLIEYVVIVLLLLEKQSHYFTVIMLVFIVGVEILVSTYPIYNDRVTLDKDIYKDGTEAAIAKIGDQDDFFYRVDKQYLTVHYCDALAQGYNGTTFYIGGFGAPKPIADFYNNMGLPIYSLNRVAGETNAYNEVENLLGMKYILSKEDDIANYGYNYFDTVGDIAIYENTNAIPMGFVYDREIKRSQFEKLPFNQRQRALSMAALVEDDIDLLPELTEEEMMLIGEKERLFDQYEISFESAENYSFVFEPNAEDELIAIQLDFDKTGKSDLYYSTENAVYHVPIHQVAEGQIFELNVPGINRIWADSPNWAEIMSLRIAKIPQNEYYREYDKLVEKNKENAVRISLFEENHFIGEVECDSDGMLYLPVPSNSGWHVFIDKEEQVDITINDAFIGVPISKGTHSIIMWNWGSNFWGLYKKYIIGIVICVSIIVIGTIWRKKKAR